MTETRYLQCSLDNSKWFQKVWFTEVQARRLLEDYDELHYGAKSYSISFLEYHDEWVEYVFFKWPDGTVLMFRIDYDR